MRIELDPALAAAAARHNLSLDLHQEVISHPSWPLSIEKASLTIQHKNRKLEARFLRLPKPQKNGSKSHFRSAKSFVLSYLRVSRWHSHIWERISCKSFVFTFPTPGGSPSCDRSFLALSPPNELVNGSPAS